MEKRLLLEIEFDRGVSFAEAMKKVEGQIRQTIHRQEAEDYAIEHRPCKFHLVEGET